MNEPFKENAERTFKGDRQIIGLSGQPDKNAKKVLIDFKKLELVDKREQDPIDRKLATLVLEKGRVRLEEMRQKVQEKTPFARPQINLEKLYEYYLEHGPKDRQRRKIPDGYEEIIGKKFQFTHGSYVIRSFLGGGNTSLVFSAECVSPPEKKGEFFALKLAASPEYNSRFLSEVEALSLFADQNFSIPPRLIMNNWHNAQSYQIDWNGGAMFVMELFQAPQVEKFSDVCHDGVVPLLASLQLCLEYATYLNQLHNLGIAEHDRKFGDVYWDSKKGLRVLDYNVMSVSSDKLQVKSNYAFYPDSSGSIFSDVYLEYGSWFSLDTDNPPMMWCDWYDFCIELENPDNQNFQFVQTRLQQMIQRCQVIRDDSSTIESFSNLDLLRVTYPGVFYNDATYVEKWLSSYKAPALYLREFREREGQRIKGEYFIKHVFRDDSDNITAITNMENYWNRVWGAAYDQTGISSFFKYQAITMEDVKQGLAVFAGMNQDDYPYFEAIIWHKKVVSDNVKMMRFKISFNNLLLFCAELKIGQALLSKANEAEFKRFLENLVSFGYSVDDIPEAIRSRIK